MVINVYKYVKENWPSNEYPYKTEINKKTASILGIGIASVYNILKEYKSEEGIKSPIKSKDRPKFYQKVDDFDKSVIRKKIHSFFLNGQLPTIPKILQAVNDDEDMPNFSETTLRRLIKHLNFKYIKRQRNNALIDRDDITIWRRKYLKSIKDYRQQNRQIFYMDETWVNAGHTVNKTWVDKQVKSKKQAFLEGLSIGARNPTSKGKRLIITHIGNENGFVEGGENIFECKKTGDYHESMDATHFEQWFENVLPKLGENAVVVMDNAPYHSRRLERIPTTAWKKK
ncbi:uncharacterized protein LOC113507267 [Trichoplusia ni]|uniref:Uncharacterized protein LOC113507267 n=1 Tax=Trichoplusia ni TaxID=7111 RepID=A0A7E5WYJ0_TRINI|nr:uncharacterized protein LOC113507267 [Trichoplusia ni]